MSYDDPFDPTLPNDYDYDDDDDYLMSEDIAGMGDQYARDLDDESFAMSSSIGSMTKKQRKLYEDSKKLDKGYGKTTIRVNHRNIPVEYYFTNDIPGSTIRNAVTGGFDRGNRFSRKEEDLYFKVVINDGPNTRHLFYDGPDEFERHFFCSVSDETRNKWTTKVVNARQRRVVDEEQKEQRRDVVVR